MTAFKAMASVCVVVVGLLAGTAVAVPIVIETVPVGNAGNAGDTRSADREISSFGSVGYSYNIGKYEVTAGQFTSFLNAVGGVDTYGLYNTEMSNTSLGSGISRSGGGTVGNPYSYSVASDFVNRPVNYVSWGDSARFSNWMHNGQPTGAQNALTTEDGAYALNGATSRDDLQAVTRKSDWKWVVTSEDEWYKSAYHKNDGVTGNYFDYPTSNNAPPLRDMSDVSGNNANTLVHPGSGPYPIDSGKYTTVVGQFLNSDSPYGTFDQAGNVWEWNESVIDGSYRCLKGGAFGTIGTEPQAGARTNYYPTDEYSYLGFRVAEVPEPATLTLLAMGGLVTMLRCVQRRLLRSVVATSGTVVKHHDRAGSR